MEAMYLEKADKLTKEFASKTAEIEEEKRGLLMVQQSLEADVEKMEQNFKDAIGPTQQKYKEQSLEADVEKMEQNIYRY
eukprot:7737590-Pyramimonas_sp.AAC.1